MHLVPTLKCMNFWDRFKAWRRQTPMQRLTTKVRRRSEWLGRRPFSDQFDGDGGRAGDVGLGRAEHEDIRRPFARRHPRSTA